MYCIYQYLDEHSVEHYDKDLDRRLINSSIVEQDQIFFLSTNQNALETGV